MRGWWHDFHDMFPDWHGEIEDIRAIDELILRPGASLGLQARAFDGPHSEAPSTRRRESGASVEQVGERIAVDGHQPSVRQATNSAAT